MWRFHVDSHTSLFAGPVAADGCLSPSPVPQRLARRSCYSCSFLTGDSDLLDFIFVQLMAGSRPGMPVFLTLLWLFVVNVCLDSPQNKGGGGAATYNKGRREQTFNICLLLHGVLPLGPAYFLLCLGLRVG